MVHKPEDHIEFIIESLTRVSFIIEYKQKKRHLHHYFNIV